MRDRIIINQDGFLYIASAVEEAFQKALGHSVRNSDLIQFNLPLEHFDVQYDYDANTTNLLRYDFEEGKLSVSIGEDFLIETNLSEKDGSWEMGKIYTYTNTQEQSDFLKSYGGDNQIPNYGTYLMVFFVINNFLLIYHPEDVLNVEEKVCKKAEWNEIKKKCRRDGDTVRLFKSYTLKKNWKSARSHKPKILKCPAWTVRGHVRRYKSGKVVFISPYVKGRERNNPDALVGKKYIMTTEKVATE